MGNPQEKLAASSSEASSSPFDEENEDYEEIVKGYSCGCFWRLCYGRPASGNNSSSSSYRYLLQQQKQGEIKEERWFVKKVKKVKEISELLAGPKWKNFIRRSSNKRRMQFQYDPRSYALNFDDGVDRMADVAHLDFSARFAVPLWMNNSDLVGRDPAAC